MVLKLITVSAVVVGIVTWLTSGDTSLSSAAFADSIPGVDQVETLTWTNTYYIRVTSKDGTKHWIQKERRLHAYQHPGLYRETMLDDDGNPISVHIRDLRSGQMLQLNLNEKQAQLKPNPHEGDIRSPFAWVGDVIRRERTPGSLHVKAVSLEGQMELDGVSANVVRAIVQNVTQGDVRRHDFLFDPDTRRLVGIWLPNERDYDLSAAETEPAWTGQEWSRMEPIAVLTHEITLDAPLDAADFRLDPPAGFAVESSVRPTVREDEAIAFLAAAARFNDGTFPDSPFDAFDRDKLNAAWAADESQRSAEAGALIDIVNRIMLREIYQPPIQRFINDHTTDDSFHYVGSGVQVGQSDRIVCWYRLQATNSYRAVYGDLSVRDVTEADLPLRLSP